MAVSTFRVAADLGAVTAAYAVSQSDFRPGYLDVRIRILQVSDLVGIASGLAQVPEQTILFSVARWAYESVYFSIAAGYAFDQMVPDMHRTLAHQLVAAFGPSVDVRHLT